MSQDRTPALGTLRDRVELFRKDQTVEAGGGLQATYTSLATVWAKVRARSPLPTNASDGRAVRASHTVIIRFRSDISIGDRVTYRGVPLEVISVEDLNGRRAYLNCRCTQFEQAG